MKPPKPPEGSQAGLPVMSDIALMGNVQIPNIQRYPAYQNIVVVDSNNNLKVAPKPDGSGNAIGYSFNGLVTQIPEPNNKFIDHTTPAGMYLLNSTIQYSHVDGDMSYGAITQIMLLVHIVDLRGRIAHVAGKPVTTYHCGAYHIQRDNTITDSGDLPLESFLIQPETENNLLVFYMAHYIQGIPAINYNANVVLTPIPAQ